MLGSINADIRKENAKVMSANGAHAYLVNATYYDKLLKRFNDNIAEFNPGKQKSEIAANAAFWPLQGPDGWYGVVPPLIVQQKGYSDLVGGIVSYNEFNPTNN